MRLLPAIALVALTATTVPGGSATAARVLTVTCDEPSGPRIDYQRLQKSSPLKLERSEDRSTGVKPLFIIDSDQPNVLTYLWGPTTKYGDPPSPTPAERATIVIHTADMISAIQVDGERSVSVFTLLPKLEFGAFYFHASTPYPIVGREWFETWTFTAKCKFQHE